MNLSNEFQPIREWAHERGISQKGNPPTQTLKLMEEVGELSKATIESNPDEVKDAIGDCVVVLTNLATLHGLRIEDCINAAYEVIKHRKGKMGNGTFVRDKSIPELAENFAA
jgi:NTP pyrophosphatase (non-canonical NTP hydrolase)